MAILNAADYFRINIEAMKYTLLLNRTDDLKKIEAEEQSRFVRMILEELEVPFEWKDDLLTVEEKIKLRSLLTTYNISILDEPDGILKIYAGRDLIGEWKQCEFRLRKDSSKINHQDRLYYEMHCNFSTIFENNGQHQ